MGSHLIEGEFQSDKYPTCPRGKVPLSVKDRTAQDLLYEYAQRRRAVDAEFSGDVETALRNAGYSPAAPGKFDWRLQSDGSMRCVRPGVVLWVREYQESNTFVSYVEVDGASTAFSPVATIEEAKRRAEREASDREELTALRALRASLVAERATEKLPELHGDARERTDWHLARLAAGRDAKNLPEPRGGMVKCEEPGWKLVAMNDPSGRRGLWYRLVRDGALVYRVELCAGREGDDAYVCFETADPLSAEGRKLYDLEDCLARGAYGLDGSVSLATAAGRAGALEELRRIVSRVEVEIVSTQGSVSYRRQVSDPQIIFEAMDRPGYSVRIVTEGVRAIVEAIADLADADALKARESQSRR